MTKLSDYTDEGCFLHEEGWSGQCGSCVKLAEAKMIGDAGERFIKQLLDTHTKHIGMKEDGDGFTGENRNNADAVSSVS